MMMWILSLAFLWMPSASIRIAHHSERFDGQAAEAASSTSAAEPHIAEMLCSSFTRPKVAMCFHGAARSFPNTLIHTSMKQNLVDALGADSTVFLHLTRKDARGDTRDSFGGTFPDPSQEDINAAANVLGVPAAQMKILEGPNMELPACPNFNANYEERRKSTDHVNSMGYLYSLAGQISHREGCMQLIREHEKRTNTKFDAVILSRADLTFYNAMPPYCTMDLKRTRRYWDWFYAAPREVADALFSEPYQRFYGCKQSLEIGAAIESYVFANGGNPGEDGNLPILLTRLDQRNMPNNVCNRFHSQYDHEVKAGTLCGPMTFKNAFNSLPIQRT